MATLKQIVSALTIAYPSVSNYIHASSDSVHLVDSSQGYTVFSNSTMISGFDIMNVSGVTFNMLQIDNKLLIAQQGGQCDCAFFFDDDFNLLEFKTNASSVKKVSKNYKKAEDQIRNTIKIFRNKGVDINVLAPNVSAHICFRNSYPRNKASEMNRSILFSSDNETKGIGLFFENSKTI